MRLVVFLVEGETDIRETARHCLERAGYTVRLFSDASVVEEGERVHPALFLLAFMLPSGSGLELCRRIRETPALARTPVVFLTSGNNEEDRVLALESGADDCIAKPFSPRELSARVQAVLRGRIRAVSGTEPTDLVIDSSAMKLSVRGSEVPTTTLEFRLIEYLARHQGRVFTRDLLLDAVWGDTQFVTPRSVDACIRRIREKIEPDRASPTYLKTIRGVGYRLDATAAWSSNSNQQCDCTACMAAGQSKLVDSVPIRRRRALG